MNLPDGTRCSEQRQQAGSMPRRTAGQRVHFCDMAVCPAEVGEAVQPVAVATEDDDFRAFEASYIPIGSNEPAAGASSSRLGLPYTVGATFRAIDPPFTIFYRSSVRLTSPSGDREQCRQENRAIDPSGPVSRSKLTVRAGKTRPAEAR